LTAKKQEPKLCGFIISIIRKPLINAKRISWRWRLPRAFGSSVWKNTIYTYQTLTPQQKEELDVFEAGKRSFYDFAAKAAENKKPATQREYRYTLNELKKAVPTLERIHQVTPQTFADFKTYLQAKGLKVNAIAKRLAIFSAICK
jgi:hypothetical protein